MIPLIAAVIACSIKMSMFFVQLSCFLLLAFNADLDNVNEVLNPWDNVILNLLLDKVSSACQVLRVLVRGKEGGLHDEHGDRQLHGSVALALLTS